MTRFPLRPAGAVAVAVGLLVLSAVLAGAVSGSGAAAGSVAAASAATTPLDHPRFASLDHTGPASLDPSEPASLDPPDSPLLAQQVDADNTLLRIAVQDDGDATWTVEYRVRLTDDNETDAFQTVVDDVRSNPDAFTSEFEARMKSTAQAASNATGREMAIENVSVRAKIQQVPTFGIVTYTFEWTNFAAVSGDTVTAGDALEGLFLDSGTRLVVAWPEDYERTSVSPAPTTSGERSVEWAGPTEFTTGEPRVVLKPAGPLSGVDPLLAGAAAVLLVGVAGVLAVVLWRRRRRRGVDGSTPSPTTGGASEASGTNRGGGAATDATAADKSGAADGASAEPPEELLSNEERVLKVVREHGGRMKQQEVVGALGWTEAKTSQVVRSLRDEGDLEGFRLGRENVLRLPEADDAVEETGSDGDGD